jgi:cyclopropane fatty-acyl-phospholipid synthase-like methyltransferase
MTRRRQSIDADYFEGLYRADTDPWGFATSAYEQAKYDATLTALGTERSRRALEVGCAIGVLTARLALVCDRLLAVDVSETALEAAKLRCADLTNVELRRLSLPAEAPDGRFDLIVLSEVAYYWDDADLTRMGARLRRMTPPGGRVLLVHWTGETDYPQTADAAVEGLMREAGPDFSATLADRTADYRLDLWRRQIIAVGG